MDPVLLTLALVVGNITGALLYRLLIARPEIDRNVEPASEADAEREKEQCRLWMAQEKLLVQARKILDEAAKANHG